MYNLIFSLGFCTDLDSARPAPISSAESNLQQNLNKNSLFSVFLLTDLAPVLTYYLKNEALSSNSSAQSSAFRMRAKYEFHEVVKNTDNPAIVEFSKCFPTFEAIENYAQALMGQFSALRSEIPSPVKVTKKIQGDFTIREATPEHFEKIWPIFHDVVSKGDTFYYDPKTTKERAYAMWMDTPAKPYVAFLDGKMAGTYMIIPNFSGLGSHVANAAYMVNPLFRNCGIGRTLAEHSFEEARKAGYQGMRFNMVVSTNLPAVHLWQSVGMKIIGTVPNAFNHPEHGLVAVYVMFKNL